MAIEFGFFDSLNGDRPYNTETFSIPFSHIIEEGVFANWGEQFRVVVLDGMAITVKTGAAWNLATWTRSDSRINFDLAPSSASLNRIDRVILRTDKRPAVRASTIMIIQGTPSMSPVAPDLMQSDVTKDLLLADIRIPVASTAINQSNITNYAGTKTTPYVTAPLTKVDVSPIVEQMNATFEEWFETVQNSLEGDVAANLAQKIAALEAKNVEQDKAITKVANQAVEVASSDTGWVNVTSLRTGWKIASTLIARVIDGKLYLSGTLIRTSRLTATTGSSVVMADLPDTIKAALVSWSGTSLSCGNINSATGFYGQIYASKTIFGVNYRNRNPYVNEYVTLSVMGAVL